MNWIRANCGVIQMIAIVLILLFGIGILHIQSCGMDVNGNGQTTIHTGR